MIKYSEFVIPVRNQYKKTCDKAIGTWHRGIYTNLKELDATDSDGVTLEGILTAVRLLNDIDDAVYAESGILAHTPLHIKYDDAHNPQSLCIEIPEYCSIMIDKEEESGNNNSDMSNLDKKIYNIEKYYKSLLDYYDGRNDPDKPLRESEELFEIRDKIDESILQKYGIKAESVVVTNADLSAKGGVKVVRFYSQIQMPDYKTLLLEDKDIKSA